MGGFGINPDFMSPEEKLHLAMGIHPSQLGPLPAAPMAKATDALPAGITLPAAASVAHEEPNVPAPAMATPQLSNQGQHEQERSRLEREGSGIHQFSERHHILGPIARIGDVALGALFPGVAPMVPGTTAHHNALIGQQNQAIDTDIAQNQETAKTGESNARATEQNAQAEALKHPKPEKTGTPEDEAFLSLVGTPNPDTGKPYTALEAFQKTSQAKQDVRPPQKPDNIDQQYADAIQSGDHQTAERLLKVKRDMAAAGQSPERPQHEPRQMVVGPDGTVIELKPGMKVPQGTKTVAGDLATGKPTADEQRRSDLAGNLNENLATLEEIATRRPDLFGPIAGRVTGLKGVVGSNDPDIGTLETIKHQIGMAQISAHGMRSAHGIDGAAESILNSFKNGPDAVKASINAARNSVKTFTGDVERAKNPTQAAPQGVIYARDPQGKLHQAAAGTPLPQGWTQENKQ